LWVSTKYIVITGVVTSEIKSAPIANPQVMDRANGIAVHVLGEFLIWGSSGRHDHSLDRETLYVVVSGGSGQLVLYSQCTESGNGD
jgi:hypothetical protein